MLSGLFVGMVLGLQGFQLLQRFGSEEALGTAATIGLVKELGPVVTALLFAGRAGTALASELGLMRATDQMSAMEMMAVDPIQPGGGAAILGRRDCHAAARRHLQRDRHLRRAARRRADHGRRFGQLLVADARRASSLSDINEGIVKSLIFGVACSLIAVYEGYYATPTAEGVGRATTRTVVTSAVVDLVPGLFDYRSVFVRGDIAMRKSRTLNLGTGAFVLLGFAALFFLTTQTTSRGMSLLRVRRTMT